MGKRVTIADIAEKLHISRSLVSKALNDRYGVNPQTKALIRYTALQMGYDYRNVRASQSKDAGEIGVVVGNIHSLFAQDFYWSLLQEVEHVCAERKLRFSMELLTPELSRPKKKGLLMICGGKPGALQVAGLGLPFVAMDFIRKDMKINRVCADYYGGGAEAAEHLMQAGHRKIGYVGAIRKSFNFTLSHQGLCDALKEAGMEDPQRYSCLENHGEGDDAPVSSEHLRRLLRSENRPTAVLCASDDVAVKVYAVCRELGLRIPEDLSVVGFDDSRVCTSLEPPLTSIRFDIAQMARYAVDMLENAIRFPDAATAAVTLDANLIIRSSVAERKDEQYV